MQPPPAPTAPPAGAPPTERRAWRYLAGLLGELFLAPWLLALFSLQLQAEVARRDARRG